MMEVLLHSGTHIHGWRTAPLHQASLTAFALTPSAYTLTQLRYDLRKMTGHSPLANSLFRHPPTPDWPSATPLETAYRKADTSIQQVLDLLAA